MQVIRCKFLVNSIERSTGSRPKKNEDGTLNQSAYETVEFCRVNFSPVYSVTDGTENNRFWKFSPNGSLSILRPADEAEKFTLGSYWYIDDIPLASNANLVAELAAIQEAGNYQDAGEIWQLNLLEKVWGSQLNIRLDWCRQNGDVFERTSDNVFKVCISNDLCWPSYTALDAYYAVFMIPATKD